MMPERELPQLPLFDGATSRAFRDYALADVAEHADTFMADGLALLTGLAAGEYTGEDVRRHLVSAGLRPHHHNAWGALVLHAVKAGILVHTNTTRQMRDARSHARRTPVYHKRGATATDQGCAEPALARSRHAAAHPKKRREIPSRPHRWC